VQRQVHGPWLAEPRPAANFNAPEKIVMRQTGDSLVAAVDRAQYLCLNNMHVLVPQANYPSVLYLTGILNSRLLNWYYQTLNPEQGEALAEVKKTNVARLPIHVPNHADSRSAARHDHVVHLVERMLSLYGRLITARTPQDKNVIQQQIQIADRQIDKAVYELYNLTPQEIELVERQTQKNAKVFSGS
jgi:TaqI-like C-terminal specificity domain